MANEPAKPALYSRVKAEAKRKFKIFPSAYASAWIVKEYRRLYDNAGSPANITLAASSTEGHAYSFPDAAFAVPWCKVVSGDTNSTGVAAVVTFKS